MTIEDHYKAVAPKLTNWLAATGSSRAEACDLVQDTFLRIWRMRDDLSDEPSAVSGLAFTIARNLRKNLWRDNARLTFVDEIHDGDAGASAPPEELPFEAEERRAALRKQLSAAFAKLPPPSAKPTPSSRSPNSPSAKSPLRPGPPKTSSKCAFSAQKPSSRKFSPKWV